MDKTSNVREHILVVCSKGGQFASFDHLDGVYIKLTKEDKGQHHWIPRSCVTRVDEHVHVEHPGKQAMREWVIWNPQLQTTAI